MSNNNNEIQSSESVFAEAFAAASGQSTPEIEQSADLQDTELDSEPSGIETEETIEGVDNSEPEDQEQSSETPETSEELSGIKEISVKGKDGKRRNIKVDFSDHDRMTKYVQKAANAVRLQSERDALQAQVSKLNESQTAIDNLQSIIDTKGFEGLIDHLNADNGGFSAWMEHKMARQEQRLHATEDELAKYDAEDKASELQKRLELIERQQKEREERLSEESSQAEISKLQSMVNPIYFKYTFDGKLGDSVAEQRQNRAMFREVTSTLDALKDQGVNVTPQIVEREFRLYTTPLLKGVNRKVKQNTKRAIDKKKIEATTNAQQAVRKGYNNDSIDAAMDSGNWVQNVGKLWAKGKLKK